MILDNKQCNSNSLLRTFRDLAKSLYKRIPHPIPETSEKQGLAFILWCVCVCVCLFDGQVRMKSNYPFVSWKKKHSYPQNGEGLVLSQKSYPQISDVKTQPWWRGGRGVD